MPRILLAEDDLFLRDMYEEVLKEEFDVTVVADGSDALQKFKMGGWDLVLLDILMPQMNGIDVLKHIKDTSSHLLAKHVVFMTNSDELNTFSEVSDMVDGCILKSSFTPGELIIKLKEFLQN